MLGAKEGRFIESLFKEVLAQGFEGCLLSAQAGRLLDLQASPELRLLG